MATMRIPIHPIMRSSWAEMMRVITRSMRAADETDDDVLEGCLHQALHGQYPVTREHQARAWHTLRAAAEQQAAAMRAKEERVEGLEGSTLYDAILGFRLPAIFTAPLLRVLAERVWCALCAFEQSLAEWAETWVFNDSAYTRAGARPISFGMLGGSSGYAYPAGLGRLIFA